MVGESGSKSGLTGHFDEAQPSSALMFPCQMTSPVAAKGNVFIVENDRILPTDSDKVFGVDQTTFETLPEPARKALMETFISENTSRLNDARARTIQTYKSHLDAVQNNMIVELKGVADSSLEAEIMMLEDDGLYHDMVSDIRSGKSAEVALDEVYEARIKKFAAIPFPEIAKMANELMQHRATMQHHLHPDKTLATYDEVPNGAVVIVRDGLPMSAVVGLIDPATGRSKVAAVVTTQGSLTSHAAIIARSLGIPYVRMDDADSRHFKNGDEVIVDGAKGAVLVQPSRATAQAYEAQILAQDKQRQDLNKRWHKKRAPTTVDGQEIKVFANLGISIEAPSVRAANPSGIGLLRTEVAQSMSIEAVDEQKWYEIFRHNASACAHKDGNYIEMTVRTLDEAGDKGKKAVTDEEVADQKEREDKIITAQLKALLRLNGDLIAEGNKGKIKIMVPMIGQVSELEAFQSKIDALADAEKLPRIRLGTMVEVPSVLDQLQRLDAEFFSVGSNDLICSLLGVDRYNKDSVKTKYDPTNISVLNALEKVTQAGDQKGIPTSICGDIASQAKYQAMLIGAGFRKLSSGINDIPVNKEVISRVNTEQARELFNTLRDMQGETRAVREDYLARWNQQCLGLSPDGKLESNWQRDPHAPEPETP